MKEGVGLLSEKKTLSRDNNVSKGRLTSNALCHLIPTRDISNDGAIMISIFMGIVAAQRAMISYPVQAGRRFEP